jgi:hypothetical protein
MSKLTLAIAVFSFITGAYASVMVNMSREGNKACQVTYRHGDKVNVLVGEWQ